MTKSKYSEPKFLRWSRCAVECYKIGCMCSKCEVVPEWFKGQCRMKKSVFELVRLYGSPIKGSGDVVEN